MVLIAGHNLVVSPASVAGSATIVAPNSVNSTITAPETLVTAASTAVSVAALVAALIAAPTVYHGKAPKVDQYSGKSKGLYNKFI